MGALPLRTTFERASAVPHKGGGGRFFAGLYPLPHPLGVWVLVWQTPPMPVPAFEYLPLKVAWRRFTAFRARHGCTPIL